MKVLKPKSPAASRIAITPSQSFTGFENRELAHALRTGCHEALERLYSEHHADVERLVRIALQRARRYSRADASDVVQDVFAKAFSSTARAAYDGEREYGPFLRRIARNTVIDWLRRTKHEAMRRVELSWALDAPASLASVEEAPFTPDLLAVARRFLVGLNPELKAVHEQRFLAADSQAMAAQKLGISRQNLRTLERRLLAGLRREISAAAQAGSARPPDPATARRRHSQASQRMNGS